MRILVDIRHLTRAEQSGVGTYTRELLETFAEMPSVHDYLFLSTGARPLPRRFSFLREDGVRFVSSKNSTEPSLPNIRHHHIRLPNKLLSSSILFRRRPTLNKLAGGSPDVVFLPNLNFTSLAPTPPYVLTIHDLSWHLFPEFYSPKMRLWHRLIRPERLIWQASRIIVPSESTKQDLLRDFPTTPEQVVVIPHGVHPRFQPTFEARDHGVRSRLKLPKRFVLFLGTLEPRKNLETLVDAVASYRERTRDDLHLVLAGGSGWNNRRLRHRLASSNIRGWVHSIGYVPREDQPALYRAALLFAWPSLYEGFGLPVLEAMASGTPVITSLTSSLPEVAGNAALLVDPYNTQDLERAIEAIAQNESLRTRLKEAGLERVKGFSWKETARKTLEVLEAAAGYQKRP